VRLESVLKTVLFCIRKPRIHNALFHCDEKGIRFSSSWEGLQVYGHYALSFFRDYHGEELTVPLDRAVLDALNRWFHQERLWVEMGDQRLRLLGDEEEQEIPIDGDVSDTTLPVKSVMTPQGILPMGFIPRM